MGKLFYTGKGDKGQSDVAGKKIDKTAPEIEAVGALDEINSLIGLVGTQNISERFQKILQEVQQHLFAVQAQIGSAMINAQPPPFTQEKIAYLESLIDEFEDAVQPERGFVVAGATKTAAWLDYARTVARRAEVAVLKLNQKMRQEQKEFAPTALAYLNRLSSLLYAMARFSAKEENKREQHPNYET